MFFDPSKGWFFIGGLFLHTALFGTGGCLHNAVYRHWRGRETNMGRELIMKNKHLRALRIVTWELWTRDIFLHWHRRIWSKRNLKEIWGYLTHSWALIVDAGGQFLMAALYAAKAVLLILLFPIWPTVKFLLFPFVVLAGFGFEVRWGHLGKKYFKENRKKRLTKTQR